MEYPRQKIYEILISQLPVDESVKERLRKANNEDSIHFDHLICVFPEPERDCWGPRISAAWAQLASLFIGRVDDGVELLRFYPGVVLVVTASDEDIAEKHVSLLTPFLGPDRTFVVVGVKDKKSFFDFLARHGLRVRAAVGDNAEDLAYPDPRVLKILVRKNWSRMPNGEFDPIIVDSTRVAFEVLLNYNGCSLMKVSHQIDPKSRMGLHVKR